MRRPWLAALMAFGMVLGVGGLAAAVPGVFVDEQPAARGEATPPTTTDVIEEKAVLEQAAEPAEKAEPKLEPKPEPQEDNPFSTFSEPEEPAKSEPKPQPEEPEPPIFEIVHPQSGDSFDAAKIEFRGITSPGAHVFAGPYEADVGPEGEWGIVLILEPGWNRAVLKARSDAGLATEGVVEVFYAAPADADKESGDDHKKYDYKEDDYKDDYKKVEFTAHQKWGSCGEVVPYDIFYGTAAPGAGVEVFSDHGWGATQAGPNGGWELKVLFPEAPHGKTFAVTVASGDRTKSFEFTSYSLPDGHEEPKEEHPKEEEAEE